MRYVMAQTLQLPGSQVTVEEGINMRIRVVIYTLKGEAVSIGEAKMDSEGMFRAEKGIYCRNR